jgi:hypothetical protein
MKTKIKIPFLQPNSRSLFYPRKAFWLCSICLSFSVLFILTACGANRPSTDLYLQTTPSQTIKTTSTPVDIPLSIVTKQPELIPEPTLPVEIDTILYTQHQDLFSLQAPDEWSIHENFNHVTFTAPQGEPRFEITVLNTGYPLSRKSFTNFIEIQEMKKAIELERYVEIERRPTSQNNSFTITKSFYVGGVLKRGASYYQQDNEGVFIADFWVEEKVFDVYQILLETVFSTVKLNRDAIVDLPVYSFDQATMHSNDYFSILRPPYWNYQRVEEKYTITETFISPDEKAVIQTLIYDDGQPISKKVAGELALALLRNNYTRKISVLEDKVLEDGREKLTWRSIPSTYQGITSFSTRQTGVFILTVMWGDDPDQYYQAILGDVFSSYKLEDITE